jgi:hypothetical protein
VGLQEENGAFFHGDIPTSETDLRDGNLTLLRSAGKIHSGLARYNAEIYARTASAGV